MKVTVESKIDFTPAMRKIESDEFWKDAAHEWHRLYMDYVPRDTKHLRDHVHIRPKEIEHYEDYAAYIYFGVKMIDPATGAGGKTGDGGITWTSRKGVRKVPTNIPLKMKTPGTTRLWDKKAIQDKKDRILIRSMQGWIDRNL
ncbi:MAG TPA: hypothetical protein IAB04_01465 [Candidatus Avimonoglobus intestinipullorum]|uniref:Uncharacterized protein n=1 Tax=Candidatus Avimonoglobus intestinipullorum TaxID=2840699 RepID=A0A9D1LTX3_9FIRM|nr:hypothetical protein [Candidatus Avimonoglobus intestinipullorum]